MRRALAIAGVLAAAGIACKSKQREQAKPQESGTPTKRPLIDPASPRPARPLGAKGPVAPLEPISIEEMTRAFELPEGVTVVQAPQKPRVGERVQATYCFQNATAKAAADKLQAALQAAGFERVLVRYDEAQPDRASLAGAHPPLRVSASIRNAQAPRCLGSEGHAYVTMTMHKIQRAPTPAARPEAPAAP